jgi:hypothetical protein
MVLGLENNFGLFRLSCGWHSPLVIPLHPARAGKNISKVLPQQQKATAFGRG